MEADRSVESLTSYIQYLLELTIRISVFLSYREQLTKIVQKYFFYSYFLFQFKLLHVMWLHLLEEDFIGLLDWVECSRVW